MVSSQHSHGSVPNPDPDNSTVCSAMTPPSTVIGNDDYDDNDDKKDSYISSSAPWPNSTFLIRASSSGRLLTLDSGRVILARPGDNRGSSIHWNCTEVKGWLHFRNVASGCYLGHTFWGNLTCCATRPEGFERFTARLRPEGGYYLMMTHWERLWKVGG